jgi:hypothetical protein
MKNFQSATRLESVLKTALGEIRAALAEADISEMDFEIYASGRIHDGNLRVRFKLGEYGDRTQGGSVEAVVEEYLRRHGWNERNVALCLPAVPAQVEDDARRHTAEE